MHDQPYLYIYFRKGNRVKIFGKVNKTKSEISIIHPEMLSPQEDIIDTIVPVYSLRGDSNIKATSQTINHLRKAMFRIVEKFSNINDPIPQDIIDRYNFLHFQKV